MNQARSRRRTWGLRWLMALIAVVGLALAAYRECEIRRLRYRSTSFHHNVQTATAQDRLMSLDPVRDPTQAEFAKAEVRYDSALAEKYRFAEQALWFGVAADLPPPDR